MVSRPRLRSAGCGPRRTRPLAAVALVLATACVHQPAVVTHAERERLEQNQSEFLAALSARDLERTVAHFADDAILHVADMPPIRGREAIHRFYQNVFRFLAASEPARELTRMSAGADMAYTVGSVTNVFAGEAGAVEHTGKFVLVWERRGGDWRITVYGISSDRAASAP